jgi:hypothetical protein
VASEWGRADLGTNTGDLLYGTTLASPSILRGHDETIRAWAPATGAIRYGAMGMGKKGLTLAKFLVELIVRVDDERLLESLEGMAFGLEYFHDGTECNRELVVGRKGLPISVCLSQDPLARSVNQVGSTCHMALPLVEYTRRRGPLSPLRCGRSPSGCRTCAIRSARSASHASGQISFRTRRVFPI